jgi:hypothetical protein
MSTGFINQEIEFFLALLPGGEPSINDGLPLLISAVSVGALCLGGG